MTLKDLWTTIKFTSLSHFSVNDAKEGDVYENLNNGEQKYPFVNWTVDSISTTDNTTTVSCYMFYIDRLLEDNGNKLDIWASGVNTLQQILNKVRMECDYFEYDNATYTNFTEKFNELCAGVYVRCDMTIINTVESCDDEIWADDFRENSFYFLANSSDCTVSMVHNDNTPTNLRYLRYFKGYETDWINWDGSEIMLKNGERLYVECDRVSSGWNNYSTFVTTGVIECYGNISSLNLNKDKNGAPDSHAFFSLFKNSNIASAPNLDYDKTSNCCYQSVFNGCTNITKMPIVNYGNSIAYASFDSAFNNTSLEGDIEIECDTVNSYGLKCTFQNTRISSVVIKAKKLNNWDSMKSTFNGCTNLNNVESHIEEIGSAGCIEGWLQNVSDTGTFTNIGGYNYPTGSSGIPEGWTVVND